MTILVGTASWTDKSLIESGKFYPPSAKDAETRLKYYASHFPMVEVDSSYYAIPMPVTAHSWAERTPAHFVFNVKAFRLFTGHQTQPKVFPRDIQQALGLPLTENIYYRDLSAEIQQDLWRRFFEAVEPLRLAGKLGAFHFQFAPWITSGGNARKHVEHCASVMVGWPFNLEDLVPTAHPLRGIDRFLDLSNLRRYLASFYSHTGRPSIDPELMIRMLIVGYCFGIRSERRLCEEVKLNLAYR